MYTLRRSDGLIKTSNDVIWVGFNDDGTFKDEIKDPEIGRSLLMSPFNIFFTWQTTTITELMVVKDGYVKFRTENSEYELTYNKEENGF